jgi:UDP-N-acetylglucosamine 3-dehydrogenase
MARCHANHWQRIDEVELRAVVSLDSESARGLPGAESAKHFESLSEALADEALETSIVDVCSPTPTHKPLALEALAAGRNLLLEKPMARTAADCDEIAAAARTAGTTVMVAHVLRYFPEFELGKRRVEAGAIGVPAAVRTARMAGYPSGGWNKWYSDPALSGGVVMDMIIHDFDWLLWTFGPVNRVFAKGLYKNPNYVGKLDYALCTLHHTSGVLSHVTGSWAHTGGFRTTFEICGDAGMIVHDSTAAAPLTISLREAEPGKPGVAIPESPMAPGDDPYYREIRHFTDCVLTGKQPDITLADAMAAVQVAEAALKSIETGEMVEVG